MRTSSILKYQKLPKTSSSLKHKEYILFIKDTNDIYKFNF